MTKWVVVAVLLLSLIALFPLSVRLADPLFTHPYEARFAVPVLFVFPEHIEVRWIKNLAEVVPPANVAAYTFLIPRDRQDWVEQQLRNSPPPGHGSAWRLQVHQLGYDTQRIELEAYSDGFAGLIYDARKTSIAPVAYRGAGPGAVFVCLLIDVGLSSALSMLVWITMLFVRRRRIGA